MRFEEFRSLIEERKKLYYILENHINVEDWEIKMNRILEIDQKLFPEENIIFKYKEIGHWAIYLDSMKSKINLLFEVGRENVIKILKLFVENQGEVVCNRNDNSIFVKICKKQNLVIYGLGKDNDLLYCLCGDGKSDWGELLHDYPDLKEFIWEEFKKIKNKEKLKRKSLIEKMIEEKDKKINNPEIEFDEKFELIRTKYSLKEVLENVNQSLTEIEI